jgi:hypothetical protein
MGNLMGEFMEIFDAIEPGTVIISHKDGACDEVRRWDWPTNIRVLRQRNYWNLRRHRSSDNERSGCSCNERTEFLYPTFQSATYVTVCSLLLTNTRGHKRSPFHETQVLMVLLLIAACDQADVTYVSKDPSDYTFRIV